MAGSLQALGFASPLGARHSRRPNWRIRLQGSDTAWAIAFVLPYVAVFCAFAAYPAVFGLWMGRDPTLYGVLLSDPRYVITAVNTLLFVAIGVNVKMFLAFLLSGFFMQRGWWVRGLLAVFLLPWALPGMVVFTSIHFMLVTQWGLLDSLWRAVTGEDGPLFLVSTTMAMAANILAYIWKWLPFWTIIFLAGRMAIPRELYEAAEVDGASKLDRFTNVTWPLMASLYVVCTLLSTIWSLGDFNTVHFISGGGPALSTHVLATLGIRDAFELGNPRMGMACVISALPLLIPLVVLLMRRLSRGEVQL
jgi:multiple sugar transport system permease protein